MKKTAGAVALVCLIVTGLDAAQGQSRPGAAVFGQLPAEAPLLSPDGAHFAMIRPVNGSQAVVVYQTNAPTAPPQVFAADGIIDSVTWARNDVLLMDRRGGMRNFYWESQGVHTGHILTAVSLPSGKSAVLLKNMTDSVENVGNGSIVDLALDDPNGVYMTYWVDTRFKAHIEEDTHFSKIGSDIDHIFQLTLLRADLTSGTGKTVATGNYNTQEWFLDGHGHPVARLDTTKHPLIDHLAVSDNGGWRDAGTFPAEGDKGANIFGLSEDGHALIRRSDDGESLEQIDLATGNRSPISADPTLNHGNPLPDEWTGHIVGVSVDADLPQYRYFDSRRQALQKGLEQAFPGLSVHPISIDLAQDKVVAAADGPRTPRQFYLLDRTTHQASLLLQAYSGIADSDLGEVRPYAYRARDGLPIPAYLTLPPGKAPKHLPLVVMPHGGPDARDDMQFDWWSQFLANRGYAVLRPNYRGSSGYGRAFTDAGLHQWGLKMQDDISDGVAKAVADGIADPKRVCIVGASYGGYAALAGATFTPDLYACAVSVAGPSNLSTLLGDSRKRGADSAGYSFWASRIGDLDAQRQQLDDTSPALHASQVKCPILLIHGDNDTTVPIVQSEIMETALKKAGKKIEFVHLEGDDHYLALAATRTKMLTEVERFLKESIGN